MLLDFNILLGSWLIEFPDAFMFLFYMQRYYPCSTAFLLGLKEVTLQRTCLQEIIRYWEFLLVAAYLVYRWPA